MHYHLEIVMPPTDAIDKEVAAILKPFHTDFEDTTFLWMMHFAKVVATNSRSGTDGSS